MRALRDAARHSHRSIPQCPGSCAALRALICADSVAHGHDLVLFDSLAAPGEWLVACGRCGMYGATPAAFSRMGASGCSGQMDRGAAYRWRRLLRGRHPTADGPYGAGTAVRSLCLEE